MQKLEQTHSDAAELQKVLAAESAGFAMLNNPIWATEAKEQIVLAIAKKLKLGSPLTNLLKILVENRKVNELGLILDQFKEIYNKSKTLLKLMLKQWLNLPKNKINS